jgi:peptidyl-prolyl cis-trans isomerase SurA
MKKFYLLFALSLAAAQLFSQTLFTYGTDAVSKDEFLRAYNKNKTPATDKEKALREYLDLYSKFKLKVKIAKEMQLDTLQQLQADMQNFRSQVEDAFMNNDKGLSDLVDEAFQRKQKDIHVLHFFIPYTDKTTIADSLKAISAMQEVYTQLKAGNNNYDELAQDVSNRFVPVQKSDLGYITALSVSYQYENIIYGLKPGEASKPYHTKNGWHVFKNLEERKSAGRWRVAQILFALPPNATPETIAAIGEKADSVYGRLKAGDDFSELAKKYSEDKLSYQTGGEMPLFGTGKFDNTFESNVFDLKNDSDFTKPFLTKYGYHIVKRLQVLPTPTAEKADDTYVNLLKQQVLQDTRINATKQKFLDDIMLRIGYKKSKLVKDDELFKYADSVTANKKTANYPISNKTIFSFTKQNINGADWLKFVDDFRHNPALNGNGKNVSDKELLDKYTGETALEYYRKHLEEYNPDFKYQMQEFREGNMLFEIMQRNVWNKAATDTVGLMNYYNEHQSKYIWASSVSVLLFSCTNTKAADDAIAQLKTGKDWRQIVNESEGRAQADSGRYEISQIQVPPGTDVKEELISDPVVNNADNTAGFVKIIKVFPANEQRSFEEARGLVINDYQNYLEDQWVAELKSKYPVKVNETVFQSLLK